MEIKKHCDKTSYVNYVAPLQAILGVAKHAYQQAVNSIFPQ